MPGSPDTVIPGSPGTPATVIPGANGTPDIVIPGLAATPATVIPGSPGTPGTPDTYCPAPPAPRPVQQRCTCRAPTTRETELESGTFMRSSITATSLIACLLFSQLLDSVSAQKLPLSSVTVPALTVVPLTLVNPIKHDSTKPGDSVRAVVAFPITIGNQLAIPAGTYVEGTLLPPAPKVKHKPNPGTQLHFTRLIFANGYTVPLDASQAEATPPVLVLTPLFTPSPTRASAKAFSV